MKPAVTPVQRAIYIVVVLMLILTGCVTPDSPTTTGTTEPTLESETERAADTSTPSEPEDTMSSTQPSVELETETPAPISLRIGSDGPAGATLPYVELEAESAATNGTIIGPDRALYSVAAEASGRRAVTLDATGQYVEFTLPQSANSIVIRYSIPDSEDGTGITAPLSLYIDGVRQPDLILTSKYAWVYGDYPFNNNPTNLKAHRFFDETRMLLPKMEAGAKVRLQKDAASTAAYYTIDFADFEQVAEPLNQPEDSLSVIDYGADPTGADDSTAAIQNAVNDGIAQGKTVWIPPGVYKVPAHIMMGDNAILRGAGMWYSTLTGYGVGVFGNNPSMNVQLSDFAIFGESIVRQDSFEHEGLGGAMGGGTVIENIWIEHTKVGLWYNGPVDSATIRGLRIRNTYADGVNLHAGVSNVIFEQSNIRNTGDDGMAMWSGETPNHDNVFQFNTVQMPNLANNIAIYGGYNNHVVNNYVADTLWQGSGINYGNQFGSGPITGTNLIANNLLVRTGSLDIHAGFGVGAIAFRAGDLAIEATILVNNNQIIDSSYEAIQFRELKVSDVTFSGNTINGVGTFILQIQSPGGSATFDNVTASAVGASQSVGSAIYGCDDFDITIGAGNGSWINDTHYCGPWPDPVYGDPILTPTPTPTPLGAAPMATNTPTPTATPPPTTPPPDSQPYDGTPWAVPGTIQAEDYDKGGEGVAYHDIDTNNVGGEYRTSEAVDIEACSDTDCGFNVGWTRANEWMKYTVDVNATRAYDIDFRVANGTKYGSFYLEVDGVDITGKITVPNTGGWQTWQTITSAEIQLTAGQHVIRIVITGIDTNFNWIEFR